METRSNVRRTLGFQLAEVVNGRDADLRSIADLAVLVGLRKRSFQYRCLRAGTTAKACLDFVRCFRVVVSDEPFWDPVVLLSLYGNDARTIHRLAEVGGLGPVRRPTITEFLERQRFLTSASILEDFRRGLRADVFRRTSKGVW